MYLIELKVSCKENYREILLAEIADAGFESMIETSVGFNAYVPVIDFKGEILGELKCKYRLVAGLSLEVAKIKRQNWNKQWEENFSPAEIGSKCRIRASFHKPDPLYDFEIVIDPKMSFGTGHHETTSLMIEAQLQTDHSGMDVLDCGCGTGILAIFAKMLGSKNVTGIDIDDWAVENAKENAALNDIRDIWFLQGTAEDMAGNNQFDLVLANINKNVLLHDMPSYARLLVSGGKLILSGFYRPDLDEIKEKSRLNQLKYLSFSKRNRWISAVFLKD